MKFLGKCNFLMDCTNYPGKMALKHYNFVEEGKRSVLFWFSTQLFVSRHSFVSCRQEKTEERFFKK